MGQWVRVAAVGDCPPGQGIEVVAGDRLLALFHVDGKWYALDGVCPHQGGPLGKGALDGTVVSCPWHGWQFDVTDGCHQVRASLKQPTFAVRIEGDDVLVEIDAGSSPSAPDRHH